MPQGYLKEPKVKHCAICGNAFETEIIAQRKCPACKDVTLRTGHTGPRIGCAAYEVPRRKHRETPSWGKIHKLIQG